MDNPAFFSYLWMMATVTYLIRMLPWAVLRGRVHNRFLQSFLYYVPYAVLGAMTFPAAFYSTGNLAGAFCGLLAALTLGWMNRGLLTVALFACVFAFLGQLLF
ncbi:MAG: AzlD domain-containing protein [Clostridia bacterium]|nr:AzlD domain-containing protein [Clostridia bacterium]